MKKMITFLKSKYYLALAIITPLLFATSVFADGKIGQAGKQAAEGIQSAGQSIVKWLVMIVLVVAGVVLIIGSQRQKESLKEKAPLVLLGVALIVGAAAFAKIIFGWF